MAQLDNANEILREELREAQKRNVGLRAQIKEQQKASKAHAGLRGTRHMHRAAREAGEGACPCCSCSLSQLPLPNCM